LKLRELATHANSAQGTSGTLARERTSLLLLGNCQAPKIARFGFREWLRSIEVWNRSRAIDSIFALDVGFGFDKKFTMSDTSSVQHVQLLVLDRIDHTRNMARYYVLAIEPTLFDQVSLVREWGRIGKPGGRRIELHLSHSAARTALDIWLLRKTRRGYQLRTGR
jgi:predicted DNA-binding WGR domain protein